MEARLGEGSSSAAEVENRLQELVDIIVGHWYGPYLDMSRAAGLAQDEYRGLLMEIALEALSEHWSDPRSFDPDEGSLEVWLCLRARNYLKTELRSRLRWIHSMKRERETAQPDLVGVVEFERMEERLWLEGALVALEADQVEALHLHHCLEWPVDQVADSDSMGRTVPETRWLLRKGRSHLRERLEGREPRKPGRPRKETGGKS